MTYKNAKGLSLICEGPLLVMDHEYYEWSSRGACNNNDNIDPDLFFTPGKKNEDNAKLFCKALCPVREECLAFAIRFSQEGIWGGTDEKERRQIVLNQNLEYYKIPTMDLSA